MSSGRLGRMILGAVLRRWWMVVLLAASLIPLAFPGITLMTNGLLQQLLWLAGLTFFILLVISVCRSLSNIFNLTRNENGITWCQILILTAIGVWIIGAILIFNAQAGNVSTIVFGIAGSILAWIFQDKIKGAAAFIHLRLNHLLNIGDWIRVPKYNVDGEVTRVTLTTVTVYNWDTTTSTIPISTLQADHFINLQKMSDGKTYGRRMLRTFRLNTGSFRPVTTAEIDRLKQYLPESDLQVGVLNAHLYRLYIYHWLMAHPHISQRPRLIVSWQDQTENGLTLQIDAFIIDSDWSTFEWQQSQIIEHIIESMAWFGLRLYLRQADQEKKEEAR